MTKLLGALLIGLYLGNKGITAIDVFTKELKIGNSIIIVGAVVVWSTFCDVFGLV